MSSIVRILVASAVLAAVSACSHQEPPDCSVPLYNLATRLQGMAKDGQADKARKEAKRYETCFRKQPRYWLLRGTLLPYFTGDQSHLERDTKKALDYANKAIALDPDNGQYKMGKVGALSELHRDSQAINLYEQVLSKVMGQPVDTEQQELERQGVFDAAASYVQSAQRAGKKAEAKQKLTPFISHICSTQPDYVKSYAQTIIWLDKQLNHKSADDVSKACADFKY